MELDWTTFVLEIVNFLVLIWILQRFLYEPVRHVITERQAAIESSLAEAKAAEASAEELRSQYENRLTEWESERERARVQLREEIAVERSRLLETLQADLAQERERQRVLEARRLDEERRKTEGEALAQATRFAASLFGRLAGPELSTRIVEMVREDLNRLPEETRQRLRAAFSLPDGRRTLVMSAHRIDEDHRSALAAALEKIAGGKVSCEFTEDPTLMAGLRLQTGSWVLRANLQDELQFFADAREGRQPD